MHTNLWDGCTLNEALSCSLNEIRTTVQSSNKESPFERHHRGKPRTEINNYFNMSQNTKSKAVSVKPEH